MISLYDLLEAANGQLFGEAGAQLFTDFCYDPRRATDSSLFVALKSDLGDGHQFIRAAMERGVSGVLCTQPPEFDTHGLSIILVKDTQAALMSWSRYVLGRSGAQVIAVAGASARATTCAAISAVLGTRFSVLASNGTATGRLAIPQTLAGLNGDHRFAVLELGASQPGEMDEMVEAVTPTVAVITHIGMGATEHFESPEQLVLECGRLIDYLSPIGVNVLNYDDDRARTLAGRGRAPTFTVGVDSYGADMVAYNLIIGVTRTGFDLRYGSNRLVGKATPLLGRHQLYSALFGLAVGLHYDIPINDALKALAELQPLPGRMSPLNGIGGSLLIDDSYEADPFSAVAALEWLKAVKGAEQRAIFVLGDMDALGSFTQRGHRLVGQKAAEVVDLLVTEGADAALAGRAALDQGLDRAQVRITYGVQDTIAALQPLLTSNDIVLIKGGAAARTELITQALLENETDAAALPRRNAVEGALVLRPSRLSWVEIDLDALANNVRLLKLWVGENVTLFAVVKANAYGHGAVACARTALLNGADYLAVASLNEALELRDAGIDAPILIMGYVPLQGITQAIRQNLTVTLYDLDLARAYDRAAREFGAPLTVHVEIDTGIGRLGVAAAQAVAFFRSLTTLTQLQIEGIYTHFSTADEDETWMKEQLRVFRGVVSPLRAGGFSFKYIHAANSAATLRDRSYHLTGVRCGVAMYGMSPSDQVPAPADFLPVMTWRSVVAQVKTLPAGHPVGYGNTYITHAEERIAVVSVGYADGFRRAPHPDAVVLVQGQRAPVIGRISMDKIVIHVDHIAQVTVGDEVVLLGKQGNDEITAEELAARWGTINYEVTCSVLPRVPRQ